jgi:hypothetical protein
MYTGGTTNYKGIDEREGAIRDPEIGSAIAQGP